MAPIKFQKKKNQGKQMVSPLPIPICAITNEIPSLTNWNYFDGVLKNDYVEIRKKGDIQYIYTQGCFGEITHASNQISENKEYISTNINKNASEPSSSNHTDIVTNETIEQKVLHLSFEESFFLSFGLGCLFIKLNEEYISIEQQWNHYCQQNPCFPNKYAAYHHFRSKGWVPKNGVRYGVDMVLYRKGPSFYHANFMVVIQTVDSVSMQLIPFNNIENRTFDWRSMSGLLRLSTTVSKEILFCYVGVPSDLTKDEQKLPTCLRKFNVTEKLMSRWSSLKEGEKEIVDIG